MSSTTSRRETPTGRTASRQRRKAAIFVRSGILALLLAGVALPALEACSDAEARSPLSNARESETALVQAVLDAVAAKDEAALRTFLVSRDEYEHVLWPEMPDKDYTPFDFVWSLNETNSRKGLHQFLARYGGLPLELVSVELGGDPEVYDDFTLYPDTRVTVRRKDTGDVGVLPSFDVLVKYGRTWKLMNYDEL